MSRFDILKRSFHSGNYIPSGRQLHRTPPLSDVKRHLDFFGEDLRNDAEEVQPDVESDPQSPDQQNDPNSTFDFNKDTVPVDSKVILNPDDPDSLLKGMKGYQLTSGDLEFIKEMQEEKLIKKLQGDLDEVQRLLKTESVNLEQTLVCKEKALTELDNFPSCEELMELVNIVLKTTPPCADLSELNAKSLLAAVTTESVEMAVDEKKREIAQMEKMVANKKRREAKERGQLEKKITIEQQKIQGLMSQLSDLKAQQSQQKEAHKALQTRVKTKDVKQSGGDARAELQAAKSRTKHQGKERKKTTALTDKPEDEPEPSQPTRVNSRSKRTDSQSSLREQTKHRSAEERPTKPGRGAKKLADAQSSQEAAQTVRRRQKDAASLPKTRRRVTAKEAAGASQRGTPPPALPADDAQGEQNACLRRSKRIASKR